MSKIIYVAKVTNGKDNDEKFYVSFCRTAFKERYKNNAKSFRNEASNKETELHEYN